nr:hypothetical protein [Clostridia bacterium]
CVPSARNPQRYYVECWWPMVGQAPDDPIGMLSVRLNEQSISNILAGMKWYSNELMLVLDGNGQVLFASGTVPDNILRSLSSVLAQEDDDAGVVAVGGLNIGYAKSRVNDWQYVSVLDRGFLVSNFSYTGRIAQALCLILLVCGVALSILAAWMRYRPLSRLYDLAEQSNLSAPTEESQDAYAYVEHSMISMMKSYQHVQGQLAKQHQLIRNHLLIRLLTGNMRSIASIEDVCFSNGICFVSDRFMVLVLNILNEHDVFFGECPSEEAAQISSFIVGNIYQELLEASFNAFVVEYDNLVVGIVNLQRQQQVEAAMRTLADVFARGQKVLQTKFGLHLNCLASEELTGLPGPMTR